MQNGQVHPEINQGAKETSVYTQGKDRNEQWYLWIGVEGTEAEDGDAVAWLVNSLPCSAARLTPNITKCASHLPVRHSYPSRTLWALSHSVTSFLEKALFVPYGRTTTKQWQSLFSLHTVPKNPGTEGGTLKIKRFWQSSLIADHAHKIRCLTVTVIGVANLKNNYCLL